MSGLGKMPSTEGGRITFVHVGVVFLSLMLTWGAWQFSVHQIDTRTQLRFEASRDRALGLITDRMTRYEDALWAGVAAVESHQNDMSYDNWHTFAAHLRIDQRYPGINGIGVIHFHDSEALAEHITEQRRTRPEFSVFPPHDGPLFMPITYIEPEDINAAAVGLDVAHELNRRTAALASRDTGTAQVSGPIVLVQDAGKTPGFLFYAPFYRDGPRADVAQRRENILGAVYAPFVVHKLMDGLLAKELRHVRFSIRDDDQVIYDEHSAEDPSIDPNPMFVETVALDFYGRVWTVDVRTDLAFRSENTNGQPTIILVAGLMIEALIIALLILMSRANARAVTYADEVTIALRQERTKLLATNEQLSTTNDELERFAYVASHDLRTPVRGINGLAEMIEEDLEDYFASASANPEVQENLGKIKDRVLRMEALTTGIMELSQVDSRVEDEDALELDQVIGDLATDFEISADQLRLTGNTNLVHADPKNFRSVLENLIGNAIKYHSGTNTLDIEVCVEDMPDRIEAYVRDNGPGIDPKFHRRIFDVFQTLRLDPEHEGTGIGLAIVKKAVERHGGTVSVHSVLGEGATFRFDWPLASRSVAAAVTSRAA